MTVTDLVKELSLNPLTCTNALDGEVTGCYICDLLSYAMGKAARGDAWITVQTNLNIVAVAALTEAACVILPEGIIPPETTVAKAEAEGIVLLSGGQSAYQMACGIARLLG